MKKKVQVTVGSGNVFADLGFPNPEEHLAKAAIALQIMQEIHARGITQARAARLLGIDQPKISRLLNGQFREFSTERLMRFVRLLGQDVEITLRKRRRTGSRVAGRIHVVAA